MSSSKSKKKRPHGQIRQSQVVMTFGPGSMFDLPNQAVIVGGLDYWTKGDEIHEPRLLAKLKDLLQLPSLVLHAPPPAEDDPESTKKTGIDSIQFPEWFMTQTSQGQESRSLNRSRRLVHRTSLSGVSKFIDEEKKSQRVVPIRFVRACKKGHIGDIDWYALRTEGRQAAAAPSGSTSAEQAVISRKSGSVASAARPNDRSSTRSSCRRIRSATATVPAPGWVHS